jgi:mannose-6-phosphate isomerase-like protein (cupin superfamily)
LASSRASSTGTSNDEQDEFFLVLDGELQIDLEGEQTITLGPNQAFAVPRAVVHRTRAAHRTSILMVEAAGVVPTDDCLDRYTQA